MRPPKDTEKLIRQTELKTNARTDRAVLNGCLKVMEDSRRHPAFKANIARVFMNSKITRLTAAAAIIIAAMVGVYTLNGTIDITAPAFAEVAEPVLYATTASFDVTLEFGGQAVQASHFYSKEPGQLRQTLADGTVNIVDYNLGKVMVLDPNQKRATLRPLSESGQAGDHNLLRQMRDLIAQALDGNDVTVEVLEPKFIDDCQAVGFKIPLAGGQIVGGWRPKGSFAVWANPRTELPLRLEIYDEFTGINIVATNFELNMELDDSLFVLEAPEGFDLEVVEDEPKRETTPKGKFEKQIIDGLKGYTFLSGGSFPPSFTTEAFKVLDPNVGFSFKQEGWGGTFKVSISQSAVFDHEHAPSDEEIKKLKAKLGSSMRKMTDGFVAVYQMPKDTDWHYAGKGLTLEDVNEPILWYRDKDWENYRVIYGDFTVEEIPPEDIPK